MLPDTLGVLTPKQTAMFFKDMTMRFPDLHFDFHSHNDYDLAVGNTLSAVTYGAKGVHVTVNGLGERCGNAPLASVQAVLKDKSGIHTSIEEDMLNEVSRVVEGYSGIAVAPNQPIVGMSSHRWLEYMLMVTTSIICIAMHWCQSDLVGNVSMPLVRILARPI